MTGIMDAHAWISSLCVENAEEITGHVLSCVVH
jgi:hypothetical protein